LTKGFLQKETLKGCGCSKKRWHYNSPDWNGEKQLTVYEINFLNIKFQGKLLICEDKKTIIIKIKLNNPEKQQRTKAEKNVIILVITYLIPLYLKLLSIVHGTWIFIHEGLIISNFKQKQI
jgi:hypothetical protein